MQLRRRSVFWVAAVIAVLLAAYVGSYVLLMLDRPAINAQGEFTYSSSFRYAEFEPVNIDFATCFLRHETWLNRLYVPLDYVWRRAPVNKDRVSWMWGEAGKKRERDRRAVTKLTGLLFPASAGPFYWRPGRSGAGVLYVRSDLPTEDLEGFLDQCPPRPGSPRLPALSQLHADAEVAKLFSPELEPGAFRVTSPWRAICGKVVWTSGGASGWENWEVAVCVEDISSEVEEVGPHKVYLYSRVLLRIAKQPAGPDAPKGP